MAIINVGDKLNAQLISYLLQQIAICDKWELKQMDEVSGIVLYPFIFCSKGMQTVRTKFNYFNGGC